MDTNEIITELRDWAIVQGPGSLAEILNEAADSLEDLDERVAILNAGLMDCENVLRKTDWYRQTVIKRRRAEREQRDMARDQEAELA